MHYDTARVSHSTYPHGLIIYPSWTVFLRPARKCFVLLCPVVVNKRGTNNYRLLPTELAAKLDTIFSFEIITIYLKFFPFPTSVIHLRGKHPSTANYKSTFKALTLAWPKSTRSLSPLVIQSRGGENLHTRKLFAIAIAKIFYIVKPHFFFLETGIICCSNFLAKTRSCNFFHSPTN